MAFAVKPCNGADPKLNPPTVGRVELPPNLKPVFDVPVEAEVSLGVSPSLNGEEVAFVVKVASEMPPGATAGFVASAALPNVNPDSPAAPNPFVGCNPVNDDEVLNPEVDVFPNRLSLLVHTEKPSFLRPAS